MAALGFLLTRSPFSEPHFDTFVRLAGAALDQGHRVKAFLYMDAVLAATPSQKHGPTPRERLDALVARGVEIVSCGLCVENRGIAVDGRVGGLPDLAFMLDDLDRLVTL
jgi:tRNA 2-thiouridine synthesizing protein D